MEHKGIISIMDINGDNYKAVAHYTCAEARDELRALRHRSISNQPRVHLQVGSCRMTTLDVDGCGGALDGP